MSKKKLRKFRIIQEFEEQQTCNTNDYALLLKSFDNIDPKLGNRSNGVNETKGF